MPIPNVSRLADRIFRKLPLRLVLTLPFVVQTVGAVTLVGYLSYRSGQQSVANLSQRLMNEVGSRTTLYLEKTLEVPHLVNQLNADAIRLGTIPGFETKNSATLEKYFWAQLLQFPSVSTIAIANERGGMIGSGRVEKPQAIVVYRTSQFARGTFSNSFVNSQGNVTRTEIFAQNYDARTRPWYQTPKIAGKPTWSPIYQYVSPKPLLGISAGLPIYTPEGKLQGVLATDIILDKLNQFLSQLHISPSGQVFIIERSGLLVASSTNQPLFTSWAGKLERVKAAESTNPIMRETTAQLARYIGNLTKIHTIQKFEIKQAQARQLVQVIPFGDRFGLDWLIVTVVPESDFMAEIQANVHRTVMLCALALLGAIGSGIWTSRRITRSLFRLTQTTQAVAAGTLDTPLPATRITEVEILTESFRQMVMDLQTVDQLRQNYAQDLARQVTEKTAALTEAQRIAKVGSWEFELAKQEVIWSQELYRIYEAEDLAPLPRPDLTITHIHPDDQERYQRQVVEAVSAHQPFDTDLRIITQKGNIRYIHAKGQPICNAQGEVVKLAGTVADISDAYRQATQRKAAEIALQESEIKFSSIFHASPDPAWIATLAEGRVLNTNDRMASFLGYSQAEMLGKTCVELNLWANLEDLAYFRQQLTQNGKIQDFEVVFRLSSGELRTVLLSAIVSHLDRQDCVIGVLKDISERKLAEIALKQSETRFLEISDSSPANIYILVRRVDGSFYFEHMSRAIETIHELSIEQILENANILLDRIHPEDRAGYEAAVKRSLENLQPFQYEWRVINPSGKIKWLQGSSRPKLRDNGEIAWHGIVIDITERKAAELSLQRYERIVSATTDAISLVDRNYRYQIVNQTYLDWHNKSYTEILGHSARDLLGQDVFETVIQPRLDRCLAGETVQYNEWFEFPCLGRQFLSVTYSPYVEVDQTSSGIVVSVRNITPLKQVEEALRQSEQRFREIAQTISQLFFVRSATTGEFIYVSPAYEKIWGRRCESLYQDPQSWLEAVHPDDRPLVTQSLAQQFTGNSVEREYRIFRPDGEVRWIFAQINLVQDEAGKPLYFIGIAVDISDRKQVELALQLSESRFQQLAAAAPVVIYSVVEYPSGAVRFEYVSPAFEEIHEISLAQVYQDATIPFSQMHPDDRASYQQAVAQAIETMQTFRHEWRIITPSGKLKWIHANSRPERRDNKEVVWHGIAQDITDRKQAEAALKAKTNELDRFFCAALDLLCIANTDGYFLRLNPQWEKTLGYRLEDLEGVKFLDYVHPEDLESTLDAIALLANQQEIPNFVNRYRCRDGSYRWIEWRSVPVGNLIYASARDISDKKQLELALQSSQAKLNNVLNSANASIASFRLFPDLHWEYEYWSQGCEMVFGYTAQEFLAEPKLWFSLVFPEDIEQRRVANLESFMTDCPTIRQGEYRFFHKDGSLRWSSFQASSRPDKASGWMVTVFDVDITDKKRAEQELQKAKESAVKAAAQSAAANRAKTAFLANMSHELRTPLNGILGYAQILQRSKDSTPKHKECLGIIQQCGEHLLTLINDILDLSKIEADKLELYPDDFNFTVFLQGLFEIFHLKAAQKSIDFTYLASNQLPTAVHADEKRLRQILMNLLSNAVKFTDTGSVIFKVTVISHSSSVIGSKQRTNDPEQMTLQKIRFQVEDTGIGMTPEQLEKIFLPFEQGGAGSRYAEGTGLGLAITQKLVCLMGSQIFVESTPNVGSRFWFDLDLSIASNSIELTPIKSTNTIIGYQGKKRKILVVDDRWENCAVLINILEPLGFELTKAANGQEGLEKAIEVQPDLILADLVMPVMDGHEMTRQLRQSPVFQTTTIIAISAKAFESDRLHTLESGCNDFLSKPLQTDELLDKIKSYLNLTWIYDQQETGNGEGLFTGIVDATPSPMVIPPPEELLALSQAAQIGDVSGVDQEIIQLQQLNPEYAPFVTRVLKLAAEFEYEAIANLIDLYLAEKSQ